MLLDYLNQIPQSKILNWLAGVYTQANVLDKAEEFHRRALALDPGNLDLMNDLASFLISKNRDLGEGMELSEHVLDKEPINPNYLFTNGIALHKTGMLEESLRVLKESWDLKSYYDHKHFLLLTDVEESLVNQTQ